VLDIKVEMSCAASAHLRLPAPDANQLFVAAACLLEK